MQCGKGCNGIQSLAFTLKYIGMFVECAVYVIIIHNWNTLIYNNIVICDVNGVCILFISLYCKTYDWSLSYEMYIAMTIYCICNWLVISRLYETTSQTEYT